MTDKRDPRDVLAEVSAWNADDDCHLEVVHDLAAALRETLVQLEAGKIQWSAIKANADRACAENGQLHAENEALRRVADAARDLFGTNPTVHDAGPLKAALAALKA